MHIVEYLIFNMSHGPPKSAQKVKKICAKEKAWGQGRAFVFSNEYCEVNAILTSR
jgi:hypothetical protein